MANPSTAQGRQVVPRENEETCEKGLNKILSSYQGKNEELIPILQQVQHDFGYLPEPAIRKIAKFVHLPESTVFGVATFYSQFKLLPSGRNVIRVCCGTACHVRGGTEILGEVERQLGVKAGETTPDLEYSLETTACFGSCALAPVVVANDKVHGRMTTQKAREMLKKAAHK